MTWELEAPESPGDCGERGTGVVLLNVFVLRNSDTDHPWGPRAAKGNHLSGGVGDKIF